MIRWCSYCQQFMGEIEPYDDFRLSHGVCRPCAFNIRSLKYNELKGVSEFFRMLFSRVESGVPLDPKKIILDSKEIGISKADLLLGILQPILYNIGLYFANGKISVAKEHLFSEAVAAITLEFDRMQQNSRAPETPRIFLALSEHNVHGLGIDFLSLLVSEKLGCRVRKLRQNTVEELAEQIIRDKPQFFGMSAALPEQWASMVRLNELLDLSLSKEEKPLMALGGASLKCGVAQSQLRFLDFTANCYDSMQTIEFLKNTIFALS